MPRIYLSPPDISQQDHAAVDAVLTSNWVAPVGPHLEAFEAALAKRADRKHAVALNSGTAALHLALQMLNVQPGDTVICPTLTFAASANPICYCGADPIFVDSEPSTWNMDPILLELELGERAASGELPKAVIVVHLYGQCANMDPILAVCERYNIPVVEDAAEALGATYKGRAAGSMGAFSFFSFNGNKIITTSGGGMLLADKASWIERALFLSTQAKEPVAHYEHREVGYNYRMSNVLAGLGLSQLDDLERRIAVKRAHFEAYRDALGELPGVAFMPIVDPDAVAWCGIYAHRRSGCGELLADLPHCRANGWWELARSDHRGACRCGYRGSTAMEAAAHAASISGLCVDWRGLRGRFVCQWIVFAEWIGDGRGGSFEGYRDCALVFCATTAITKSIHYGC